MIIIECNKIHVIYIRLLSFMPIIIVIFLLHHLCSIIINYILIIVFHLFCVSLFMFCLLSSINIDRKLENKN
jgi:hypothetical protein